MSLWPISELVRHARKHHYALGYFESWNLESLQGVLDAAEMTGSPIIIGFNGEFLSRSGRRVTERIRCYAELGKAGAADARVPCGLIFNECPNDDWVRRAVLAGFNLVMPADSGASYDDYRLRVASLAEFTHRHGAAVEAEVGHLPFGSSGLRNGHSLTDPDLAARFVDDTKVDLLAVSVGNVHVLTKGEQKLDLKRLSQIGERVNRPLVLHGGTGIPASSIREAIKLGVTKVNYGTYLKQRYLEALRSSIAVQVDNPHELLGMGGEHDVMVTGRLAVRDAVLERIELLGCCGKADL
jgi:ketose-bisphosphate aldolase